MLKRHNWVLILPLLLSLSVSGLLGYQEVKAKLATASQRKVNLKFYKTLYETLSYKYIGGLGVFVVPENQPVDIYQRIGKPLLLVGNNFIATPMSLPWLMRMEKELSEGKPLVRSQPYFRYSSLESDVPEAQRQLNFIRNNAVDYIWVDSTLTDKLYHIEPFATERFKDTYTGHELWLLDHSRIAEE